MRSIPAALVAVLVALAVGQPAQRTASAAQIVAAADPATSDHPALPTTSQDATPSATAGAMPYSLRASAACSAGVCRIDYPRVAVDRRLDIQFVSCFATSDQPSFGLGIPFLAVNDAFSTAGARHVMLWNMRSSFGSTVGEISQPIKLTVSAGQRAEIGFTVAGTSTAESQCMLSGELVFLQ